MIEEQNQSKDYIQYVTKLLSQDQVHELYNPYKSSFKPCTKRTNKLATDRRNSLSAKIQRSEEKWLSLKQDLHRILDIRVEETEQSGMQYPCPNCDQVFRKPCALGGHISRVHKKK